MSESTVGKSVERVVVAGGSGFVGRAVTERLRKAGYDVLVLTRSKDLKPSEEWWDGETVGSWARLLEGSKAVVNLSGAPVTLRWTDENRALIMDSRVKSTSAIGQAIRQCKLPPEVWVNASALGIYGPTADAPRSENCPVGEGFIAEVCLAWERAQIEAEVGVVRKVRPRMGIVLGKDEGAFPELAKYTKLYLGGAQGDGRHWMSWIHLEDVAAAYLWAIEKDVEGPFNLVAPEPIRNSEFMACLRKVMGRPWAPPAPAFAIRLVGAIRNMQADVVLESQRAVPAVLLSVGFPFKYEQLEMALVDLAKPQSA